jgi:hypothetical protein
VPLQNPDGVEYVFVAPPAETLLSAWLACACVLVTAFLAVRALARTQSLRHLAEAQAGRWLAPIAALGVVALGILPAVLGVGEKGSVVGYFLYDLRCSGCRGWLSSALNGPLLQRVIPLRG